MNSLQGLVLWNSDSQWNMNLRLFSCVLHFNTVKLGQGRGVTSRTRPSRSALVDALRPLWRTVDLTARKGFSRRFSALNCTVTMKFECRVFCLKWTSRSSYPDDEFYPVISLSYYTADSKYRRLSAQKSSLKLANMYLGGSYVFEKLCGNELFWWFLTSLWIGIVIFWQSRISF